MISKKYMGYSALGATVLTLGGLIGWNYYTSQKEYDRLMHNKSILFCTADTLRANSDLLTNNNSMYPRIMSYLADPDSSKKQITDKPSPDKHKINYISKINKFSVVLDESAGTGTIAVRGNDSLDGTKNESTATVNGNTISFTYKLEPFVQELSNPDAKKNPQAAKNKREWLKQQPNQGSTLTSFEFMIAGDKVTMRGLTILSAIDNNNEGIAREKISDMRQNFFTCWRTQGHNL